MATKQNGAVCYDDKKLVIDAKATPRVHCNVVVSLDEGEPVIGVVRKDKGVTWVHVQDQQPTHITPSVRVLGVVVGLIRVYGRRD